MDYIIYFVITIGILVFVHEFGHFAAAKLSKMRVDVFALGFGKRLFGWNKLTGFSFGSLPKDFDGQGNTDYRLALLPLGGYVKIAGMIDESMDTKALESEPKPWEFRSKGTMPKLFVISAGVIMNLLLALSIFWGINFFQGKQIFKTTVISGVENESPAAKAGFQSYDKILSINSAQVKDWEEVLQKLLIDNQSSEIKIKVERNGSEQSFSFPRQLVLEASQKGLFLFPHPTAAVVQEVLKNSPAEEAKFKADDYILSIDGISVQDGQQINNIISSHKNEKLNVVLLRDEDTVRTIVKTSFEGKIGISHSIAYSGEIEYRTYGFFASISSAFSDAASYTVIFFSSIKNVIVGKIAFKQVFGGPVKIAQYAVRYADIGILSFLSFLAVLSLTLSIINILPFPVLDGGHLVIILIEGIFKRELPLKVKIAIQNVGFVLLLLLMAFILYNDFISL